RRRMGLGDSRGIEDAAIGEGYRPIGLIACEGNDVDLDAVHDELMRCSASAVKHLRERAEILVAADRDSDIDVLRGAGGFAPLAGVDDEVSGGRADDGE